MPQRYSIIIPVCHGGLFLHRAVTTLGQITPPADAFEILIVGDTETLKKQAAISGIQENIHFITHFGNRPSALNEACIASKGDVWIFADDDCVFPEDWLLRIEDALERNPEASVIGGSDVLPEDTDLFALSLDQALNAVAATGGIRHNADLAAGQYYPKLWNMVVKADAARLASRRDKIFDTNLNVHEDVELVERIRQNGGKIIYVPDIIVGHYRDTDFRSFILRNAHMAHVCRQKGIHTRAHMALTIFFTTLLALAAASSFATPTAILFGILFGGYSSVLAASGVGAAWRRSRPALMFTVPALIFALHVARATGYTFSPPHGMQA